MSRNNGWEADFARRNQGHQAEPTGIAEHDVGAPVRNEDNVIVLAACRRRPGMQDHASGHPEMGQELHPVVERRHDVFRPAR